MMEELLKEQEYTIRAIQRMRPNYKKLGRASFTKANAEERLRRLREEWAACRRRHVQLDLKATTQDREKRPYFAEDHFSLAEEEFDVASDYFCEIVSSFAATASGLADSVDRPDNAAAGVVQLPRVPLPKFSGSYAEWPSFADHFTALILNNGTLEDVQRLYYLKGALEGSAAIAVSHIPTTAANFRTVWEILRDRYENLRMVVGTLVGDILSHPPLADDKGDGLARLRDRANENLAQLANLGRPTGHWDDLLVAIMGQKLDKRSREDWEMSLGARTDPPSYKDLDAFLQSRIRSLEAIRRSAAAPANAAERLASARPPPPVRPPPQVRTPLPVRSHATVVARERCAKCGDRHLLFRCRAFRGMSLEQRRDFAEKRGCCFNCLRGNHTARSCPSESRCTHCGASHNTLLHPASPSAGPESSRERDFPANPRERDFSESTVTHNCMTQPMGRGNIILATAIVWVERREGGVRGVRALLDQGSETTFVSEGLVQALRLTKGPASVTVMGAGDVPIGHARARVHLTLRLKGNEAIALQALVLKRLSSYATRVPIDVGTLPHLRGLPLADPDPNTHLPIDIIIGADYFGDLLRPGLRRGKEGTLVAQETVFGWVISGPCSPRASPDDGTTRSLHARADDLQQQLRLFWELEEATPSSTLSPEEQACERHFVSTVTRRTDGRYVVRLPLRTNRPLDLGHSRTRALSMLRGVERRLQRDRPLEVEYQNFLTEYERLDHMEEARTLPDASTPVYLPHHPVVKLTNGKARLRVVFNASCPTSNGRSLNDLLLPGPKLQSEIFAILLRWRIPRFVIKADIAKMFRQIRVHADDADLQRILWRREPSREPSEFRLTTVTYGTACAPYLAQRVLLKLAEDEGTAFPLARAILLNNFYVDDVLFGADSVAETVACRDELTALLQKGGFELSKWAANTPLVLTHASQTDAVDLNRDSSASHPVLGVDWCASADSFGFVIDPITPLPATKRTILSTVARLYDPLGWAAPVVVKAKILLQELWLTGSDWDEPVPKELLPTWEQYLADLPLLQRARVPRWFGTSTHRDGKQQYELHGFADASARAYGAVVFAVSRDLGASTGPEVTLVASRTKVAPIKTVSIPRLELCAAALLARLLRRVADDLPDTEFEIHAWSDSQVVLAWLARTPSTWAVFVANRVGLIHEVLPGTTWRHVSTADNPADCASRGMLAGELIEHGLWWSGPAWLSGPRSGWPRSEPSRTTDAEMRVHALTTHDEDPSPLVPLPGSVSSWAKILRITALCFRFIASLRRRRKPFSTHNHVEHVRQARILWLRWLQKISFSKEIKAIQRREFVGVSSALRKLNPFLDDQGLLRVGGRLSKSGLSYDENHPIILPKHPLVQLLVEGVHRVTLHGGPMLTLSVLRRTYWLLGARDLVRRVTWRCVVCARHRATPASQIMADLPSARVRPSRPFEVVGVDYAGPLWTRTAKGRGHRAQKSYLAVFVCFATRAIHLELVSDCSTAGFMAALRRFTSRRGRPTEVYSDNGTNFRGAARELANVSRDATRSPEVEEFLTSSDIKWTFSPPGAPHFGGLWEAGVKAVKRHLARVVGTHTLTFEEMSTLLCEIEACLNSRPLTPLSRDPTDFAALTPAHFLTGSPLVTVPGSHRTDTTAPPLSRWRTMEQMRTTFWKRWHMEYLHTLQERSKWWRQEANLQPGDMVVIRDPNSPPASWRLARVDLVHPGTDQRVRVVTVRTAGGTFTRPITQLVRLPVHSPETPQETPEQQ